MFAEKIVVGFNRVACVGVLAIAGLFAGSAAHAQNATNTVTLTPPTGVTNPGTSCTDTDSDATTTISFAGNVCTARDSDPITAPKLHITKTASTSPMVVGVAASYTLKVDNTGTAATTAVATVTDTIPTGLTIGTLPAGCSASGQAVTCTIAAGLPATNGTRSFVIPVTPTAAAAASVTNTASVTGGGDATCPAEEGCSSTVTTPVNAPKLKVVKTASAASFIVGVPASYTLTINNGGTAATTAATAVSDPIPAGLTIGTLPAGCSASGQTVTCTIAAGLAVGSNTSFTIPVTPTAAAAANVTNTATISGGGDAACPSGSDCSSTVTTPVSTPALELTKNAVLAADQSTITYGFSVRNTGGAILNNVTISDPKLPGLSCTSITVLGINATQTFACTGNVYSTVAADFDAGSVVNVATATGTPAGGTTSVSDDSTVTTPLVPSPSLSIAKTADKATYTAVGDVVSYSYLVTNTGNV
ncbi:hypothetical protein, partial [Stenotrophomonas sp.]|uniref:DUF7507 domain-containing protein n=1 Tax=Stenotrophomonas sp. TaxID=69392 RepID=UPI00289C8D1E